MTGQRKSTLTGWVPDPGALVWRQMYSPFALRDDTVSLEELVEAGVDQYGDRELQRVYAVSPHNLREGVLKFSLGDPSGRGPTSWPDSDWCVLEDASDVEGALF